MRGFLIVVFLSATVIVAAGCSATSNITIAPRGNSRCLDEGELSNAFGTFKSLARERGYCLRGKWYSDYHFAYEAWPPTGDDVLLTCDSYGTVFSACIVSAYKSEPSPEHLAARTELLAMYKRNFGPSRVRADWESPPAKGDSEQTSLKGVSK